MKKLGRKQAKFGRRIKKTFWRKMEKDWDESMSLIEKLNFDVQYSDSLPCQK